MAEVFSLKLPVDCQAVLASIRCEIGLPVLAHKVLQLMQDGPVDAHALAAIITQDQSLSLRVLRLANSPFYGFSRKINTVKDAVVVLGDKALRNMVLILAMRGMHNHFGATEKSLWEESAAYAMAARFLAERIPGHHPEEAFMAGLMSNVGEVVANNDNPKLYQEIFDVARRRGDDGTLQKRLAYSFTELGAAVLSSWNFSLLLVTSLFYADCADLEGDEHNPLYRMTALVFLARQICQALKLGGYRGSEQPVSAGYTAKVFSLSEEDLEQLKQDFSTFHAQKASALLNPD
jgi:HD-like signal output (HDOD) protein